MRVLTIIDSLGGGGIETTLLRCIPRLRNHGVEIVLAVHSSEGGLREAFVAEGCPIHVLPKTPNLIRYSAAVKELVGLVAPDVLHSRMGYGGGGGVLGARLAGVPSLLSLHSTQPGAAEWKADPVRRLIRSAWFSASKALIRMAAPTIVGHSVANLDAFDPRWRTKGEAYRHVPNGIVLDPIPEKRDGRGAKRRIGVDEDRPLLLHVGNMTEAKNHVGLVALFAKVLAEKPDALLVLVGGGPNRARVEEEARRLGIADSVQFRGFQASTARYYDAADVFVFPSLYEGFGNVLVEAQLHRLPIVASDIPAHREAVALGQHDYLFPVHRIDLGADLVLGRLALPTENYREVVDESYRYAIDHFSIDRMVANIVDIYGDVYARSY